MLQLLNVFLIVEDLILQKLEFPFHDFMGCFQAGHRLVDKRCAVVYPAVPIKAQTTTANMHVTKSAITNLFFPFPELD